MLRNVSLLLYTALLFGLIVYTPEHIYSERKTITEVKDKGFTFEMLDIPISMFQNHEVSVAIGASIEYPLIFEEEIFNNDNILPETLVLCLVVYNNTTKKIKNFYIEFYYYSSTFQAATESMARGKVRNISELHELNRMALGLHRISIGQRYYLPPKDRMTDLEYEMYVLRYDLLTSKYNTASSEYFDKLKQANILHEEVEQLKKEPEKWIQALHTATIKDTDYNRLANQYRLLEEKSERLLNKLNLKYRGTNLSQHFIHTETYNLESREILVIPLTFRGIFQDIKLYPAKALIHFLNGELYETDILCDVHTKLIRSQ